MKYDLRLCSLYSLLITPYSLLITNSVAKGLEVSFNASFLYVSGEPFLSYTDKVEWPVLPDRRVEASMTKGAMQQNKHRTKLLLKETDVLECVSW